MRFRESYRKFVRHPATLASGVSSLFVLVCLGVCYPIATLIESDIEEGRTSIRKKFETQRQEIFKQYDQDRSGFLDRKETERMHSEELVNNIVGKFDELSLLVAPT